MHGCPYEHLATSFEPFFVAEWPIYDSDGLKVYWKQLLKISTLAKVLSISFPKWVCNTSFFKLHEDRGIQLVTISGIMQQ